MTPLPEYCCYCYNIAMDKATEMNVCGATGGFLPKIEHVEPPKLVPKTRGTKSEKH